MIVFKTNNLIQMTVYFTYSEKNYQFSHEELKSRLIALRNANRSAYLIKANLSVAKFNFFTRIVWICLHYFQNLRNSLFKTDLTQVREIFEQLKPQVSDSSELTSFFYEALEVIEPKKELPPQAYKLLRKSSQGYCSGLNWRPSSEHCLKKLNDNSSSGVKFNPEKLSWFTTGGNCSAIALDVINRYAESLKKSPDEPIENKLLRIVKHYRKGGNIWKMRARQGAFNCIELSNQTDSQHVLHKISALAKFHDLSTSGSSPTFDLLQDSRSLFRNTTSNLAVGTYLLRVIKPENNEKMENCGHSMALFRTHVGDFFFDPNKGLEKIESRLHDRLFEHLKDNYVKFDISQATFVHINEQCSME